MLRQQVIFIGVSALIASLLSLTANHFNVMACDEWVLSLCFYLGMNLILMTLYNITRRSEDFTGILLGCVVAKLLLALLVLLLFRIFSPSPLLPFALHFIAHFVIFTVFEIRFVLWLISSVKR